MQGRDDVRLSELLEDARAGETTAAATLLEALLPRIRRMVHRRLQQSYRPHNDWAVSLFSTGDIVQELMLQAARDLDSFQGGAIEQLVAWLSTQVEHRILEHLRFWRAGKRDQRRLARLDANHDPIDTAPSPFRLAASTEAWQAFHEILAQLPAPDRAVLEHGLETDASWQQIADDLGLKTAEAARQRHKRARARVSVRLARRYPELFRPSERDDDATTG